MEDQIRNKFEPRSDTLKELRFEHGNLKNAYASGPQKIPKANDTFNHLQTYNPMSKPMSTHKGSNFPGSSLNYNSSARSINQPNMFNLN